MVQSVINSNLIRNDSTQFRDMPFRGTIQRLEKDLLQFMHNRKIIINPNEKEKLLPILEAILHFNNNPEVSQGIGEVANLFEFCDIAKLRTDVFTEAGFIKYFEVSPSGMLYDANDERSIILRYRRRDIITGSIGLVLDIQGKPLKSEEDGISYSNLRKEGRIAELNRLVIDSKFQGNKVEFRELYRGVFNIALNENIKNVVLVFRSSQEEMYKRFGGMRLLHRFENYKGIADMSNSMFVWKVRESLKSDYFMDNIVNNPNLRRLQ